MADGTWRDEIRICPICGDSFKPSRYNQKFCKKIHYHKCPVCGKLVKTQNYLYPNHNETCCSKKCTAIHKKETCIQKFGGPAPSCSKIIQEKAKQTCIKNFGTAFPSQNKDIKEKQTESYLKNFGKNENPKGYLQKLNKSKSTCLQKYGFEYVTQTDEFKKQAKNSSILRYGTEYPMQNEAIAKRQKDSVLKNYGVTNPMKSDVVKAKLCATNNSKYGYSNVLSDPNMRISISQTIKKRYGVPWYCMSKECILKNKNGSYRNKHFQEKLSSLGITWKAEFCLENKLFDFYLPEYSLLIEVDPSYTHSTIPTHWGTNVSYLYHKNKSDIAVKHGYQCVHIFDWDDEEKIINNLITRFKIPARKCSVHEVSSNDLNYFLNYNHYQCTCRGQKIKLGLYYDDKLIEVITFGTPRYNHNYEWELLRLCTKQQYKIIGGASKLFKYFVKEYSPSSIISYCDYSKFNGSIYPILGMKLKSITAPAKVWSKGTSKITDNLLRQRGYDQLFNTNYGKGTSNDELMIKNKWLPVYDCGQFVFEWKS